MSRTLTFVLAASAVVLAVLVFTLIKMAPLTRPEIFFLKNQSLNVNYVLQNPNPKGQGFNEEYKEGFIRMYVTARNTIQNSVEETENDWNNIVKPWSSDKVYDEFQQTDMFKNIYLLRNISCDVSFRDGSIIKMGRIYTVYFDRVCKNQNSGGQTDLKHYKIEIAIQSYLDNKSDIILSAADLDDLRTNPLGIQVTEYNITNNNGIDPLSDLEPDFYKEGI